MYFEATHSVSKHCFSLHSMTSVWSLTQATCLGRKKRLPSSSLPKGKGTLVPPDDLDSLRPVKRVSHVLDSWGMLVVDMDMCSKWG